MPKAKHGNFTLRKIVTACPAEKAAHRMTALQRSGQYSELRFIQRGKSAFDIVGYKWPDKGARRSLGIGRSKNPSPAHGATPNKVTFAATKKRGTLKAKNPCMKTANPSIESRRAVALSKLFHGFDPRKIKAVNLKWPKALTALGVCMRVDYACDKWDGKDRIYFHDFVKPATVFAAPKPQKDGTNLLVIHGRFKITDRGIEG